MLCHDGREALCLACSRQLVPPPVGRIRGVGAVPALFAYEGGGARVVQALKFRDGRRLVGPLADGLCGLVPGGPPPLVTWIPTSPARRRARGFDQAELLARALARRLGCRCGPTLRREPGPSQTGRSRSERRDVHLVALRSRRSNRRLVVVDDVCTTGSTIRSAALALAGAGVDDADFVVVARTP